MALPQGSIAKFPQSTRGFYGELNSSSSFLASSTYPTTFGMFSSIITAVPANTFYKVTAIGFANTSGSSVNVMIIARSSPTTISRYFGVFAIPANAGFNGTTPMLDGLNSLSMFWLPSDNFSRKTFTLTAGETLDFCVVGSAALTSPNRIVASVEANVFTV